MGQRIRKIIIAPDSFKECLTAREVARALEAGIRDVFGDAVQTVCLPVADGGEGTLDTLTGENERVAVTVTGADGSPVDAVYGRRGSLAVVEMARAAGLETVPKEARHAAVMTTFGVGELIRHALTEGADRLLLTVGGSATNDGGCGMIAALGARFLDGEGREFLPTGGTLGRIAEIDLSGLDARLRGMEITVATDVRNPLCGETGATRMFAPQKGVLPGEIETMEQGMRHYADLVRSACGRDVAALPGAGAAGGIAVPLIAFAGARTVSGIDAVLGAVGFAQALEGADAVLTGEGKMDRQSFLGKAISGVVRAAGKVPVYAFAGCLGDPEEELLGLGVRGVYAVRPIASDDADSMRNAARYLRTLAAEFAEGL